MNLSPLKIFMPVTTCLVEGMNCCLEYQKDFSENTYSGLLHLTYSGLLHLQTPVLFSFSDSLFIPHIKESHQEVIKNAVRVHEELREENPGY
jgi:hypothetical protein